MAALQDRRCIVVTGADQAFCAGLDLRDLGTDALRDLPPFLADTHVRVGVYPGPVLVDLPRRVGMAKAREMSMTGNFVDADTALRIGLANHVVAHDELVPFTLSWRAPSPSRTAE